MKKWSASRLCALLCALLMLACASALADDAVWAYDALNACLELEGELSGDVVVPSEVDGCEVTALKFALFQEQHDVVSLTLPDTVRALQSYTISYMDNLTSVRLPENLQVIDNNNFTSLNALTEITIPASVRCIDASFNWCENLSEIRFEGECPLFIHADDCFSLLSEDLVIYVPDDQLTSYKEALADCPDVEGRIQPGGWNAKPRAALSAEDDFEFDASTGSITRYLGYDAYVEIPSSIGGQPVTAIAEKAFYHDYCVYCAVIPEGVTEIGDRAFYQASNLIYAEFPTSLRKIGEEAFFNAQTDSILWREGLEEIGAHAFAYDYQDVLDLPSTLRVIGEGAFESASCHDLYLGSSLESIGSRAFADSSLSYMVLDKYQLIDIAEDAFANTWLTDLDLPWDSSFENRDAYAALLADQCPDCTVWINNPISAGVAEYPENDPEVMTIENGVWTEYHGNAPDLTVWTGFDEIAVYALGEGLFRDNQSIRSFYPHHGGWFTSIGDEAFAGSSLEYIELFGTITEIGRDAFRDCAGLKTLTIPSSVTYIGEGALNGCTGLETLIVECDPAILPEGLLDGCTALTGLYASADASDEQIALLSAIGGRPWYSPVVRVGEEFNQLTEMPYEPLPAGDFWYDTDFARLDRYNGYELNLILPREADGTQLTMIGGGMMQRACSGDNFELELPVRSVVIPENITEIPAYAFWNCETLETVICYAPIDLLNDCAFKGCVNLREVVFVNGVNSVGHNVFDGCQALETVYLGAYLENTDESSFKNEDGSEAFSLSACLTDPAQLPDVDALLAAVKSDPMPEPEPEPTPAPAQPIGEEGAPFFGSWQVETMGMDGSVLTLADLEMVMILTLNEDGSAGMYDGEETSLLTWTLSDGVGLLDDMELTISEDGALIALASDGSILTCVRYEGEDIPAAPSVPEEYPEETPAAEATDEPVPAPEAADLSSGSDRLERKYVCTKVDVSGITLDASALGAEYSAVFHEDGSMTLLLAGVEMPGTVWTQTAVQTDSGEVPAFLAEYVGMTMEFVWNETGFEMNYFDSMLMYFEPEA